MIVHQIIDGRPATIAPYGRFTKVVFDDGEVIFLTRKRAVDDCNPEQLHNPAGTSEGGVPT
jgi:hypothetical protein